MMGTATAVGAAATTSAATGMRNRNIDHVYADIGVRGASVAISPLLGVLLRFLDLIFLDYFFALDHAAAAVCTVVLTFFADSTAARTARIVFDLGTGDLLLCGRLAAKAQTFSEPA